MLTEVNENIIFNYDFGYNWNIKLTLLDIYTDKETHGREFPRVLSGQGLGIIEDCGGVGGLEDMIKTYTKRSGEEYENYVEWLDKKEIDFNKFDKDDLTYFAKCANIWFKESYENFDK